MFDTNFHLENIHPSVWIAPGAVVVGDVTLEADVSVWFQAVLRGDTESLTIGEGTNIQEGCILHADPGYPLVIGRGVTVGHGAVVHGARVGDGSLIGIRSVLLNGVVIGENSIVAAGTICPPGKVYPPGSLILGTPGRVIRALSDVEMESNQNSASEYVQKASAFREHFMKR